MNFPVYVLITRGVQRTVISLYVHKVYATKKERKNATKIKLNVIFMKIFQEISYIFITIK